MYFEPGDAVRAREVAKKASIDDGREVRWFEIEFRVSVRRVKSWQLKYGMWR